MRSTFAKTLVELGELHPQIMLLSADLGFMALEPFSEALPDRFINVGVAEQNMVGLGVGLAEAGFVPFLYSIVTFATLRAYEAFRNGAVHQRLPLRIVGVGGGFEYGSAGSTHHGLEDLAVFRTLPGMGIVAPADAVQARSAILQTWNHPGPLYYRLSKDEHLRIPGLGGQFKLGHADRLREGSDVLIVSVGTMASDALAAAEVLASRGLEARVLSVSSFNPDPVDDLLEALRDVPVVVSLEAHYANGGLGSFVAETIAEAGIRTLLLRCGVKGMPNGRSGKQSYYHELHGLTKDDVVRRVVSIVARHV